MSAGFIFSSNLLFRNPIIIIIIIFIIIYYYYYYYYYLEIQLPGVPGFGVLLQEHSDCERR